MGNIASIAKAGIEKVKGVFGKGDEPPTPSTGAVPVHTAVGYSPVPEPKFRNPEAAQPMNRMLHVSKELEEVPPVLQVMFGLPPFLVSSKPGNTLVKGRNAAKRRAAVISEAWGESKRERKITRRIELDLVSA